MIIHILKLIRSRMGGSGWILAELLVVFVVIWFMTSYFLMMGKSWYEPVGYDSRASTMRYWPSVPPTVPRSLPTRRAAMRLRATWSVSWNASGGMPTWRPWRSPSLPCPIPFLVGKPGDEGFRQRKRTADDRLAGLLPCVWHPSRLGRKPGEAGRGSVRDKGRQGSGDIGGVGEAAIWHDRRYRGRYLPAW